MPADARFFAPPGLVRHVAAIAYNGAKFSGWASQPGRRTVQGELERALRDLYGLPVRAVGSSRTDAGVHALGNVFHFDAPPKTPPKGVAAALNAAGRGDWRVLRVRRARAPFHARYSACGKTYFYLIDDAPGADPLRADFAWRTGGPRLSPARLRAAAAPLVGRHDFLSFCVEAKPDTVRELRAVSCARTGGQIKITLTGSGFLRGMARMIVGALVQAAAGKAPPEAVARALARPAKGSGGFRAPAAGLYLARVSY